MAYKITDACIQCGTCEANCPVEAIKEEGGAFVINQDECVQCGACASNCPVEAISEE